MDLRIAAAVALVLALSGGLLSACEKTVNRETGERTIRPTIPFTVPGTAAHGERLHERWQSCMRLNSRSVCDRRVPGGRTAGGSPASATATDPSPSGEGPPSGEQPTPME